MKKAVKGGILAGAIAAAIGIGYNFLMPRDQIEAEQYARNNAEISDIINTPKNIDYIRLEEYNRKQLSDLEYSHILKGNETIYYTTQIFELSHKKKQNQKFIELDISLALDEYYNTKLILPYNSEYFLLNKKIFEFWTRIGKETSPEKLECIYNEVLSFAAELKGINIVGAKKLAKDKELFEIVMGTDIKSSGLAKEILYFSSLENKDLIINILKNIQNKEINRLLSFTYSRLFAEEFKEEPLEQTQEKLNDPNDVF